MSITLRLLAAPIMGAAFALFLPFIGFAMLAVYGGQIAWRALCEGRVFWQTLRS